MITSLPAVGVRDALDERVGLFQVGCGGLVHRQEGQARCARLQARDHAEVGILFPFQFTAFYRTAHDAQRPDAGIAHVRPDHLAGAACRNHLVVDQVRGGARKHQVPFPLADDLVPGGEGDQVGESSRVNAVSILYIS